MASSKQCKRCGVQKPSSAFRSDPRYRDGLTSWCMQCHRERNSEWARENRKRLTKKARIWRESRPQAVRMANLKCKAKHKSRYAKQHAAWAKANRDKRNASAAKHKAAKLRATPPWANLVAIGQIYAECSRITRETGIQHHVDHIVPLQNKRVCGLHCESNLRVITATENVRKKNKLIEEAYRQPDMFIEPPKKAEQSGMFD